MCIEQCMRYVAEQTTRKFLKKTDILIGTLLFEVLNDARVTNTNKQFDQQQSIAEIVQFCFSKQLQHYTVHERPLTVP